MVRVPAAISHTVMGWLSRNTEILVIGLNPAPVHPCQVVSNRKFENSDIRKPYYYPGVVGHDDMSDSLAYYPLFETKENQGNYLGHNGYARAQKLADKVGFKYLSNKLNILAGESVRYNRLVKLVNSCKNPTKLITGFGCFRRKGATVFGRRVVKWRFYNEPTI